MRNVVYAINVTLDGCCDHTKPDPDEEVHDYYTQILHGVDTLVFGRKTYELMVPFWPDVARNHAGHAKAMIDFAEAFNAIDKLVFSRTLEHAEDKNTRIVRTGLHDEIVALKQQQGKNILLGGVDLPSQLIQLGLVDEFLFVVLPIIVGEGRRLLDDIELPERPKLKLVGSKTFRSGAVALHYLKQ